MDGRATETDGTVNGNDGSEMEQRNTAVALDNRKCHEISTC